MNFTIIKINGISVRVLTIFWYWWQVEDRKDNQDNRYFHIGKKEGSRDNSSRMIWIN